MKKILLLLVVLAGCGGGGGRLSEAECKQWAEEMVPTWMLEEVDAEFQQEVHGRFLEECRAGKVDRQELNCLLGSDDEVVRLQCVVDGEKRTKRNPFLPR